MKSLKLIVILSMLLLMLVGISATAQRRGRGSRRARSITLSESWQVLGIHDKERALVYEVFYRSGLVNYRESLPVTSETWDYSTNIPSILGMPPVLGYWNTPERRNDRVFGANSTSAGFTSSNVASLGDAAAWVFRPDVNGSPSAVILGLRAFRTPAGNTSVQTPIPATFTLPPRSVARAAVIFRRTLKPVRIDFGQTYVEGDDEKGGYLEVARNDTNAAMTINVTGRMNITVNGVPTDRRMTLRNQSAGTDVTLIVGRFPTEPDCFAAAVIVSPLP